MRKMPWRGLSRTLMLFLYMANRLARGNAGAGARFIPVLPAERFSGNLSELVFHVML